MLTLSNVFVVVYCVCIVIDFIVVFVSFLVYISIITFIVEHHVHPVTGQYQESHVNVPAGLEPVVVLVDGVWLHLVIDLLVLQLCDVMDCLQRQYQNINLFGKHGFSYPAYLDWLVNLVVNNEIELFQHHVPLHDQVWQLRLHLKILHGNRGLR